MFNLININILLGGKCTKKLEKRLDIAEDHFGNVQRVAETLRAKLKTVMEDGHAGKRLSHSGNLPSPERLQPVFIG